MAYENPLRKPRETFDDVIDQLRAPDSPVGIDVAYTHAVVIDFLEQISSRLDAIEERLNRLQAGE